MERQNPVQSPEHGSSTSESTSSRSRSRRAQQSSSDESSMGQFYVSNTKFRVGAPPVRPLPLDDEPISGISDQRCRDIKTKAIQILRENHIPKPPEHPPVDDMWDGGFRHQYENVYLVSRSIPDQPSSASPTLMIEASWNDSSSTTWERVVTSLKQYVDELYSLGLVHTEVSIEMIATDLVWPMYMGMVPADPQLQAQWPSISQAVLNILQNNNNSRDCMRAISLCRLGFSPERDTNPITVYVAMDYEFAEHMWAPVTSAIEAYLRPFNLLLKLEHNTWYHSIFQRMTPRTELSMYRLQESVDEDYPNLAHLGADISASRYIPDHVGNEFHPSFGTLGCFIELKSPRDQWKKFALTNYHVVRSALSGARIQHHGSDTGLAVPDSGTFLVQCDRKGIKPGKASFPFEHPSRRKHNELLKIIGLDVDEADSPGTRQKCSDNYDSKKRFFDDDRHKLGTLWAASGLARRSRNNQRLDWALLDVIPTRQGTNALPNEATWKQNNIRSAAEASSPLHVTHSNPESAALRSMAAGHKVYKYGARTGPTRGYFHGYKILSKYAEDAHLGLAESSEFEFRSSSGAFADSGDSGSVVYDRSGRLVGLLFTGLRPQKATDSAHALVTPIEDIFEDIKKFTGAVDIRVARP